MKTHLESFYDCDYMVLGLKLQHSAIFVTDTPFLKLVKAFLQTI